MRRRVHNVDANHGDIVRALRTCGASVESLASVGGGVPDLLVGFRATTDILEVKTEDGELEPSQEKWIRCWRGRPVVVVRSSVEALRAIGAIR